MMKKINYKKRILINILTLPINVIANIGAVLVMIGIRAISRGKLLHIKIESHELAKIKRKR